MILGIEIIQHEDGTWEIELTDHEEVSWETLKPMSTEDAIKRVAKEMRDAEKNR